jgi:hypothetical protein
MAFSLEQFGPVLDLRDRNGNPYLLIGGQAVCFWATRYLTEEDSLQQWIPFVSKDIDFQGGRDDLIRFAKQLGVVARFPHKKEMTAWAGAAVIKVAGGAASVDFVRQMPGVKLTQALRFALERDFQGYRLRVLDPITLLSCKVSLALKVNQDRRRDADHARIMVVCVRAFLREILRGVESGELPQRGWLSAVERVLKLAEVNLGKKATKELGIDWSQALPLFEIAISSHRAVIQLREKRLPQWAAKLRRR